MDREAWLGKTSNTTRIQALGAWQQASIQGRLGGDLYWQFGTRDLSFGNSTDVRGTIAPGILTHPEYSAVQDGFTIYIQDAEAKILVYEHAKAVQRLNH